MSSRASNANDEIGAQNFANWAAHNVRRFELLANIGHLDKAIEYHHLSLSLTRNQNEDVTTKRLARLLESHFKRFQIVPDWSEWTKAVLCLFPKSSRHLLGPFLAPLFNLVIAPVYRSIYSNDRVERPRLITAGATPTPEEDPDMRARFIRLASECRSGARFQNTVTEALEPVFMGLMDGLCALFGKVPNPQLHKQTMAPLREIPNITDPKQAIEYELMALSLTSGDDPDLHIRFAKLSSSYWLQYSRTEHLDDLNNAITYRLRAYLATPEQHPKLPLRLSKLSTSYHSRFDLRRDPEDLDKSIEYQQLAHSLTSRDHSRFRNQVKHLGNAYYSRFILLRQPEDLDQAIAYQQQSYLLRSQDHLDVRSLLIKLGSLYRWRYHRIGSLEALEKGIEHKLQAHSLTYTSHPGFYRQLVNLGASYCSRFSLLEDMSDLDKAIEYKQAQLTVLALEGRGGGAIWFSKLASFYRLRYHRVEKLDTLNQAIEYELRAKLLTPQDHPTQRTRASKLSYMYSLRYCQLNVADDLDNAIKYRVEARSLTPEGHHDFPRQISDLGTLYSFHYQLLNYPPSLDQAINHLRQALLHLPEENPLFPLVSNNLGLSYFQKYQLLQDITFLVQAKQCFQQSACALAGSPRERFSAAVSWARVSIELRLVDHLDAYQKAIELIPELVWLGTTTDERYLSLGRLSDLPLEAASAALDSSRPELALEWLEKGRSVVWKQMLLLRSPLDDLQADHSHLAEELQIVRNELQAASSNSSGNQAPKEYREHIVLRHHNLANEFSELIAQVRALPGFSEFHKPNSYPISVVPALRAPVVVVSCHGNRCDALIVWRDNITKPTHLLLGSFSASKASVAYASLSGFVRNFPQRERGFHKLKVSRKETSDSIMRDLLLTLWSDVAKPILDFLQLTPNPTPSQLPHLIWCMTGQMSFLPIHAAGDYSVPDANVAAYAISSYTPSLTALLSSTKKSGTVSDHSSILAVGMQTMPRHSPLPGIKKELACIREHAGPSVTYTEVVNSKATTSNILDEMEKHDWVHFACHASQDLKSPANSGFFLHDGTLSLNTIMQKSFKNKGLAFLSACQTAKGDENVPDEAVHLASGMLMAGFQNVIATMWSVGDQDAPLVADRVYNHLLKDGKMQTRDTAKALHDAVLELRSGVGVHKFTRWAQFIHMGS